MASRLAQCDAPSQAVVGPLGCGKSSLRRLVEWELHTQAARVTIVNVALWPFENARAAVKGIVGKVVDAIHEDVCAPSLRGIPSAYAEAMSAAGGVWGVIAKLGGSTTDPFVVLNRIDEVAGALNHRYVLWIEDLERFASAAASDKKSSRQLERLAPIRATISEIQRLKFVTVVTATTGLLRLDELQKLAEFVEAIEPFHSVHLARLLRVFREGCLRFDPSVVDPASLEARNEMASGLDQEDPHERERLAGGTLLYPIDAFAALCISPRALKHALRSCLEFWESCPGEIDFDDLLTLHLLKQAHPRAFAAIADNINAIRGFVFQDSQEKKAARERVDRALVEAAPGAREGAAVRLLRTLLFEGRSDAKPQGVRYNDHANYWARFSNASELSALERDQPVLRSLRDGDAIDLMHLIADPARTEAVYDFRRMLTAEKVVGAIVPVANWHISNRSVESRGSSPSGLATLRRLVLDRTLESHLPAITASVAQALTHCLRADLELTTHFEVCFTTGATNRRPVLEGENALRVKAAMWRELGSHYGADPSALLAALRGARDGVLAMLLWGPNSAPSPEAANEFEGWSAFASTLLDAALLEPETVLPVLAHLVTVEFRDENGELRYKFDPDLTQSLFGGPGPVLRVFRGFTLPADQTNPQRLRAVIAHADASVG